MTEQIDKAVQDALKETSSFKDVPLPSPKIPTLRDWVRAWFIARAVNVALRFYSWRANRRPHVWRCHGYANGQGTGVLTTPKPMTEAQAIKWLMRAVDGGHITYIDREHHFLFYKPKQ